MRALATDYIITHSQHTYAEVFQLGDCALLNLYHEVRSTVESIAALGK